MTGALPVWRRALARRSLTAWLLAVSAGCAAAPRVGGTPPTIFGGDRPVVLQVPVDYDGTEPRPLLLALHGYTSSGVALQRLFGLDSIVNTAGVFLLAPNGTVDARGNPFWNATDACCNLAGATVDDVAYLTGLISDVQRAYRIDPRRIYVVGHSNGGFMAHRLACEAADRVAAVAVLAGVTWQDASRCTPSEPVSVLAVHGDADRTIRYEGGDIAGNPYPGARTSMERWQALDGCGAVTETGARMDLDRAVPGPETVVSAWTGCPAGVGLELWTLEGGGHIPRLSPAFATEVWAWLAAHPKR